ncbi:MAG TPA: 3D domain-containing protein [Candidatus Eremiobacteraceae bacterium]|nr:3D domain-containing protein [Candidatus Eremiobacteraceae bacterium]
MFITCIAARSAAVAKLPPREPSAWSYTITSQLTPRFFVAGARRSALVAYSGTTNRLNSVERGDAASRIAPIHVVTRVTIRRVATVQDTTVEYTPQLRPGARKIVRRGSRGLSVVAERVTTWDGIAVDRVVVYTRVVRPPTATLVREGEPSSFAMLKKNTPYRHLIRVYTMEATAYTADTAKANPTGYTANGMRARWGIVAVDPDVIPLGTTVFIPGYGLAIAADTGGAIVGHRIDLCMERYDDAIRFGRQPVVVYVVTR